MYNSRLFSPRQEYQMPAKKVAKRKAPSRKKVASRKRPASKKKTVSKKKAVSRKKTVARKRPAKKKVAKKASKKKVTKKASKKKAAKKKPAAKKRPAAKKKPAAKKTSKKKVAKKAPVKKKVAKKATVKKKVAKKASSKKKVSKRKPAPVKAQAKKAAVQKMPAKPVIAKSRARRSDVLSGPIHGIEPYVVDRGEDYMSQGQLEHFHKILSSWKSELMNEVDRTVHHMQDEAANFPDPNDRATQESEFGLELRTRDRERKLIRKINSAIARIEDGSYGYCDETGEEIGLKRLEARPVATLCLEAQERREKAERQFRDRDDRYR